MTRIARITRRSLAIVVLLTVGAVGCSKAPLAPGSVDAVANDASLDRSGQRLPWRIRATVAVTPAPPPAGCLAFLTSVIEGNATHLGRFRGVGSTCITGQVAPDPDPPFTPSGPGPYATATFTNPRWILTAANGDELWLENEGVAVFSGVDMSLKAEGTQRIVGGTGRFDGATGEASIGAVNDGTQPADDFSGEGWIRFDR